MYRQYEDPHKVQDLLNDAIARYEKAMEEEPENYDRLFDLYEDVEALRERLNFAWQDDEYDELCSIGWEL